MPSENNLHFENTGQIMLSSPLVVNPSRQDVWWGNFHEVKKHYDETGHLTMYDARLANWLTYQRHEAKTLSKNQQEALKSIGYKSIGCYKKNEEEEWTKKFLELKSNPSTNDTRILTWLYRQRVRASTGQLLFHRKEKLLEIGVDLRLKMKKPTRINPNSVLEIKWQNMYHKLKDYRDSFGNVRVPKGYKPDPKLGTWVFTQRKKYHQLKANGIRVLREDRIKLLEDIGFEWKVKNRVVSYYGK